MKDNIFTLHANIVCPNTRQILSFNNRYWNIDKDDLEDLIEAMESFSIDHDHGWSFDKLQVGPVLYTISAKTHPELFI